MLERAGNIVISVQFPTNDSAKITYSRPDSSAVRTLSPLKARHLLKDLDAKEVKHRDSVKAYKYPYNISHDLMIFLEPMIAECTIKNMQVDDHLKQCLIKSLDLYRRQLITIQEAVLLFSEDSDGNPLNEVAGYENFKKYFLDESRVEYFWHRDLLMKSYMHVHLADLELLWNDSLEQIKTNLKIPTFCELLQSQIELEHKQSGHTEGTNRDTYIREHWIKWYSPTGKEPMNLQLEPPKPNEQKKVEQILRQSVAQPKNKTFWDKAKQWFPKI